MKKLSITARITIWYTIFLAVIATALIVILTQAQAAQQKSIAEREIVEILADVSEKMAADGEEFVFDNEIEYYQKATYISIYDAAGDLIVGRRPASVAEFPALSDKTSIMIKDVNGSQWYVYDSLIQSDDDPYWIRGMMKHTASRGTGSFLLQFLLVMLPGFIVVAALGGRAITRRAFRPLRSIIRTTNEIRADADLSRRVPRGENHDELYELTDSINKMFDSIEDVLSREKQFTSDVSHELRTPIAVIQSQSDYALEDPEYSPKALQTINQQARQMGSLVNRLLTLSRSDAGTLRLEKEDIDFSELLTDIAEQQEFAAADQDIEITADIPAGIHVTADEGMLIRVILNLVSNAIKYGKTPVPEGAPAASPAGRIRISLREEGDHAVCTVADSGPGIPEAEQSKVWDRFYQIDHSRTGSGSTDSSAGLGLSMVRALTKAMGGTVSLQSSEGSGAAFTVRLPAAKKQ